MGKKKPELGWSIVGGLSAFAAGFVTRKLLEVAWKKTTGNKPPETPESPDVALREAMVWAIVTGVAMGVTKLVVTREAAKAWRRATGDLPASFRELKDELD